MHRIKLTPSPPFACTACWLQNKMAAPCFTFDSTDLPHFIIYPHCFYLINIGFLFTHRQSLIYSGDGSPMAPMPRSRSYFKTRPIAVVSGLFHDFQYLGHLLSNTPVTIIYKSNSRVGGNRSPFPRKCQSEDLVLYGLNT